MTAIKPFSKGVVLNNNINCLCPCSSLSDLTPYYSLPCTHKLTHFLYLYLPVSISWWDLLGILYIYSFLVPHASSHSLAVGILVFTPEPQTLLLLPPNQYFIHGFYPKIIFSLPFKPKDKTYQPKISDTHAPPHDNNYRVNLNKAQGLVMRYIWCHHLPSRDVCLYEEEGYIQATMKTIGNNTRDVIL